jgi:hypothetical protein
MTDNQVGAICAVLGVIAFFALAAFRIWLDHKEAMKDKE